MTDIIKKGLLTAIGTASIAAEKADKILRDIRKKGLINTKEARSLVRKLTEEAERERKRIKKIISAELKKQIKKTKPIVRKGRKVARKAVSKARKRIIEEKILSEKELEKVDMPIGVKFNAQTPEEIAISILAKMIDVKNTIYQS